MALPLKTLYTSTIITTYIYITKLCQFCPEEITKHNYLKGIILTLKNYLIFMIFRHIDLVIRPVENEFDAGTVIAAIV
jgi:hypothetical protein